MVVAWLHVRLLLAVLASLGFYVPGNRLYVCAAGKPPAYGPQGCELVRIPSWARPFPNSPKRRVSFDA